MEDQWFYAVVRKNDFSGWGRGVCGTLIRTTTQATSTWMTAFFAVLPSSASTTTRRRQQKHCNVYLTTTYNLFCCVAVSRPVLLLDDDKRSTAMYTKRQPFLLCCRLRPLLLLEDDRRSTATFTVATTSLVVFMYSNATERWQWTMETLYDDDNRQYKQRPLMFCCTSVLKE